MKRLVLLGASGSIGEQTLDVIKQYPNEFEKIITNLKIKLAD